MKKNEKLNEQVLNGEVKEELQNAITLYNNKELTEQFLQVN